MRRVLLGLVCSGGLAIAGCGGVDSPVAEEAVVTATAPLATAPSSPAPSTTAPPDRPEEGALRPGTEYTVGDTIGDLMFSFRSPETGGVTLEYGPNQFGLYRDDQPETMAALWVTDTDRLNVADIDPPTGAPTGRSELPTDLFQWLQERPFLETLEPPHPISVGDATGTVMVARTMALDSATDPFYCATTAGDPSENPLVSIEGCAALFVDDQGGPWTSFPGTVTEFALLRLGASEVLVLTERLADDTRPTPLGDLKITVSA